jgi:predicted transposase/invertase (TIGR01784 family)
MINMLTLEFKMEEAVKVWKEEGREEGIEEGFEKGIETGRAEGEARGRAEGKFEVARTMLDRKMSVSDIIDITGLNEQDILSLQ